MNVYAMFFISKLFLIETVVLILFLLGCGFVIQV